MAVRIDPPRRGGITGSRSEYLLDYLQGLVRQITFEFDLYSERLEEIRKENVSKKTEVAALRTEIEALKERLNAMNTETPEEG